jgi:hypothetical protein
LNSGLSSFHSPPIESVPADAPTWRHAGGDRSRGDGTGHSGPGSGGAGTKQPGAQSYADETLLKLNMTIWYATIYWTPVVRGTVMVSLR